MDPNAPLTPAAPEAGEVADPSASPAAPEVQEGSGQPATPAAPTAPASPAVPAGYVEETRFNGLMSEFNKVQNRLKEIERSSLPPEDRTRVEKEELSTQVTQLQAAIAEMQLEAAKDAAVAANPALAPFKDLLYAESPEEVFELAKDLSARLQGVTPPPATPAPAVQTPPVPVVPGSAPFTGPSDDDLEAAKEEARATGNWGRYLEAKHLRQTLSQG